MILHCQQAKVTCWSAIGRNGPARHHPGVREQGEHTLGIPRNLGGPVASRREAGTVDRGKEGRRGRVTGSRSAAIGPMKQGNRPKGPCGGKSGTGARNRWVER